MSRPTDSLCNEPEHYDGIPAVTSHFVRRANDGLLHRKYSLSGQNKMSIATTNQLEVHREVGGTASATGVDSWSDRPPRAAFRQDNQSQGQKGRAAVLRA